MSKRRWSCRKRMLVWEYSVVGLYHTTLHKQLILPYNTPEVRKQHNSNIFHFYALLCVSVYRKCDWKGFNLHKTYMEEKSKKIKNNNSQTKHTRLQTWIMSNWKSCVFVCSVVVYIFSIQQWISQRNVNTRNNKETTRNEFRCSLFISKINDCRNCF